MAKKILIIEADATALRLTEYTLKQRGYQVISTCNGLEGLIAAQKESPDLIILDVILPGIDGYEVCKRLRSGTQTANIPILVISGKAREEDIAIGFRAGASDYLSKPAVPSAILARVESLISSRPGGQTGIIAFINAGENPGMTVVLSEIAAAIGELGKQVTLAEITPAGKNPRKTAGAGRAIIETTGSLEKTEPACEVLPSGLRMLHVAEPEDDESAPVNSIEMLRGMGGSTDYLLMDLPLKPSPFTRSVLAAARLVVIASGYRLENVSEIGRTVTLLRFLGVPQGKTVAILIEPEGNISGSLLASVKPYFEINLGIDLAGVISFDAKMYQLSYLENQPIIKSGQNSQFAQSIRQVAQYIFSHNILKSETVKSAARTPVAEKGK